MTGWQWVGVAMLASPVLVLIYVTISEDGLRKWLLPVGALLACAIFSFVATNLILGEIP